jgi:hypothetical protein
MCQECIRQVIRSVRARRPAVDRCAPTDERPDGSGVCSAARSAVRSLSDPPLDC